MPLAMLRMMDKKLTGARGGALYILEPRNILSVDPVGKRTFLYAEKDVYETPLRLYEMEDRLSSHSFVRISKSAIVDFNQIKSIRPEFHGRLLLTMQNGKSLIVSRQYADEMKKYWG